MIIATVYDINSVEQFSKAGIHAILLGAKGFSVRACKDVDLDELKIWKSACDTYNIRIYMNCLKLIEQQEIEEIKLLLKTYQAIGIDGIYIADEGIMEICDSMQLSMELIYQPETLMTNAMDVDFYIDQGIHAVCLAHELSLDEILNIADKNSNVEILAFGYFSVLYSRRPLISNYLKAINSKYIYKEQRLDLIEQTRTGRMPIYEDKNGTYIFSEQPINSFDQIAAFKKAGIHRFRIDSIFFDDQWTLDLMSCIQKKQRPSLGSDHWYHQATTKVKEPDHEKN